jgi:hypothetical protein
MRSLSCYIAGLAPLAALMAGFTAQASAEVIYDNGPIVVQLSYNIGHFSVSDSFIASSPATLTSAQVGLEVSTGKIPVSANWQIGTTSGGDEIASGFATFDNTHLSIGIYSSTFAISGNLNSGGTYYLTLINGVASDGTDLFWDANGGPSTAYQYGGDGNINSESFQIYGEPVPEPSTGALLLLGFGLHRIGIKRNWLPNRARQRIQPRRRNCNRCPCNGSLSLGRRKH